MSAAEGRRGRAEELADELDSLRSAPSRLDYATARIRVLEQEGPGPIKRDPGRPSRGSVEYADPVGESASWVAMEREALENLAKVLGRQLAAGRSVVTAMYADLDLDPRVPTLFGAYYLQGMSWKQVARLIGTSIRYVYMLKDKGIAWMLDHEVSILPERRGGRGR